MSNIEKIAKDEYVEWIINLKKQINISQVKTALSVNSQLIFLYWDLGRQIFEKQEQAQWGSSFINQLSKDLKKEFPEMSGFSPTNLHYIRKFYKFYCLEFSVTESKPILPQAEVEMQMPEIKEDTILPQAGVKFQNQNLLLIPWGHHKLIIDKCETVDQAFFYVDKTIENSWSRAVLEYQVETDLFKRTGNATSNFKLTLPALDSDLVNAVVKSEYYFEFLKMSEKVKETDLEKALIRHMAEFLTELGKGFAYMGRQYPIKVGSKEFKVDLLFYHTILRCYIVIELKVREFEPEFTGKLVFYVTAVDDYIKSVSDKPTIGILLCKDKDDVVVDCALKNLNSPVGVSKMKYTELSEEIKAVLPRIEDLQGELLNFKKGSDE